MARKVQQRNTKKAIYVFWEGESEEAYSKSLKRMFANQAVIKPHREKGTFETARSFYRGNRAFQNDLPEYDELWFFFDTEISKADQWERNMKALKEIIASRRKNPIKIRLLMSTGCVESGRPQGRSGHVGRGKRERQVLGDGAQQPQKSRGQRHFHRVHRQPDRVCKRHQRGVSADRYSELHHPSAAQFKQICVLQGFETAHGRSQSCLCRSR